MIARNFLIFFLFRIKVSRKKLCVLHVKARLLFFVINLILVMVKQLPTERVSFVKRSWRCKSNSSRNVEKCKSWQVLLMVDWSIYTIVLHTRVCHGFSLNSSSYWFHLYNICFFTETKLKLRLILMLQVLLHQQR